MKDNSENTNIFFPIVLMEIKKNEYAFIFFSIRFSDMDITLHVHCVKIHRSAESFVSVKNFVK